MKDNTKIIFYSILAFHLVWCLFSFYSMFSDFDGWTIYHSQPFLFLLFTLVWLGVCFKNYIFGFIYIGMVMAEFLTKATMRDTIWADVFGEILFPIDLIFVAVLLFLFKTHFGILQRPDILPDQLKRKA